MHFYVIVGSLLCFYCLLLELYKVEKKVTALLPAFILLSLFIALRNTSIGTDTLVYAEIYHYIPNLEVFLATLEPGFHGNRMEWGFFFLLSSLKALGASFTLVLFIVSIATCIIFSIAYKKLSPSLYISIMILSVSMLFVTYQYNIIRQGLAASITILALYYLSEQKTKTFIFTIIIAACFHVIALLALLVLPIKNIKWQSKYIWLSMLLFGVLGTIGILEGLIFELRKINIIFWRVFLYLQKSNEELKFISWSILSSISLLLTAIYLVDSIREKYKKIDLVISYYFVGTVLILFTHQLSLLSLRVSYLFYAVEPILIVAILTTLKEEKPKYLLVCILAILILCKNILITAQFLTPYST